jgi:lipopolysaccharide transport system permease protein
MNTQIERPDRMVLVADEAADATPTATPEPEPPAADSPVTYIRPMKGWQLIDVRELWRFRELLLFFVWRDVKVRYKQAVLGAAWAVLQPLMLMVVFTVFFGRLAAHSSGDLPYPLFAFAGLMPWTFFAAAIGNSGNSVVVSERLVTKIYFPRLLIPFASVGASLVDFLIAFSMLLVLMAWYGVAPGLGFLAVPLIMAVVVLAALAVGTTLAALNVAYRDFRYVIPFLVQLWMFATPTVYTQAVEREGGLHPLLALNPMTTLVGAFRNACLGGPIPWASLGVVTAAVVLAFVVSCLYFRKAEERFADVI